MEQPETTTDKLCSNCKLNPAQPGQRWCRKCRTESTNLRRKAAPPPKTTKLALTKPDPHNANKGTPRGRKVLAKSIQHLGFGRSILLDRDGVVIAGNKTREAALKANPGQKVRIVETDGSELIAVRRMDLSLENDDRAKLLAIADNRASEMDLAWNPAELGLLAQTLDLSDFFNAKELGALTAGQYESTANDEVPDLPAVSKSLLGDLYLLGPHRLLCGDSTNPQKVMEALGGRLAHLCWTDPPYNVAYTGKTADALEIENDSMSSLAFAAFLNDSMSSLASGLAPGAAVYVAHSDSWGHLFRLAFLQAGLLLKEWLIWAKDSFVMGRQDYHWQHEPILYGFKEATKPADPLSTEEPMWEHETLLYGWKPGAAHNWYSNRRQSTILSFARPKRSVVHPTMKPVALVEYCIRNSTKPTDVVLDPFGGSGTTLMACQASDRVCCTLELDPAYVDVIVERWETATGLKAELIRKPQEVSA